MQEIDKYIKNLKDSEIKARKLHNKIMDVARENDIKEETLIASLYMSIEKIVSECVKDNDSIKNLAINMIRIHANNVNKIEVPKLTTKDLSYIG